MAKMYLYNSVAYPAIPRGIRRTDTGQLVTFPAVPVDADWTAIPGCTVSIKPDGDYRWNDSTLTWDAFDPVAEAAAIQTAKDEIHKIADNQILAFLTAEGQPRTLEGLQAAITSKMAAIPSSDAKDMLLLLTALVMKMAIRGQSDTASDVPSTPHTL